MIIRIFGVQAKADLTLWTFMKVMLRMELATFTKFPIASNLTIGTTERIMKDVVTNTNTYFKDHSSVPRHL